MILLTALSAAALAAPPAGPVALRVGSASGTVWVETGGKRTAAKEGMKLGAGDVVETGRPGSAEIIFDNGTLIGLEPGSSFKVGALEGASADLELGLGTLLARVRALAGNEHWRLRARTTVVAVRGTELGVSVDSGSIVHAAVFNEGKAEVSSGTGEPVVLDYDHETSAREGFAPLPPQPIDYFRFASKRMAELRKRQKYFMDLWLKKYGRKKP